MTAPLSSRVAIFEADVATVHDIVHGPASGDGSLVPTESGNLRTLGKVIADAQTAFDEVVTTLPVQGPYLFRNELNPHLHLRQFSTRRTSVGAGAKANATIAGGALPAITVEIGGQGYLSPRVLITGDGSGAKADATAADGIITAIVPTVAGTGYTHADIYLVDGPVVVLVGDSISSETPNPSIIGETLWGLLTQEMAEQNPDKTITFFNRAIGAQTWTAFETGTVTTNWPAWYANHDRPWMDYIEELQPDVVICAFGMNDRQNFAPATLRAALAAMALWDPVPDIILCTPLVPHAGLDNPDISSPESQEGRDIVAGYTRGYAQVKGFGLLDFNRQLRLVRDGIDVRNCALKVAAGPAATVTPYVCPAQGADFAMSATFAAIAADFWTGLKLNWQIARGGVNAIQYARLEDSGGKLKVSIVEFNVGPATEYIQTSVVSTLDTPAPGSDVAIIIFAADQRVRIAVNGCVIFDRLIARFGGVFAPVLSADPSAPAKAMTVASWIGEYGAYNPRLDDEKLWGGSSSPYQGNGINHPSTLGVAYVFAPVIQNTNWQHSPMSYGDLPSSSGNIGLGVSRPRAKLHVAATRSLNEFTPLPGANSALFEGGISLMADSTGIVLLNFGDEVGAAQFSVAYLHTTDTYSESMDGSMMRAYNAGKELMFVPSGLVAKSKTALPPATVTPSMIYVTDDVGGPVPAFSDGLNWRRVTDRAVIA